LNRIFKEFALQFWRTLASASDGRPPCTAMRCGAWETTVATVRNVRRAFSRAAAGTMLHLSQPTHHARFIRRLQVPAGVTIYHQCTPINCTLRATERAYFTAYLSN